MGWEARGNRQYYYRSVRVDGATRKVYVGSGKIGEMHALVNAQMRERRHEARQQGRQEQRWLRRVDSEAARYSARCIALLRVSLILAGYHEHRGEWRGRLHDMTDDRPAAGSPTATKDSLIELIQDLSGRANAGSRDALQRLRQILHDHPEIWQTIGDLSAVNRRVWIEAIARDGALLGESLRLRADAMRADLAGGHPTPVEQMLVDQVVVTWLALQHAETLAAATDGSIAQAKYRQRRLDSCQQRYLRAVRALTRARTLFSRGLAPMSSLRLFDDGSRDSPPSRRGTGV